MSNTTMQTPDFLKKKTAGLPKELVEQVEETKTRMQKKEEKEVTPMEREALLSTIRGLGAEQIDVLLDNIPIELIYNRLGRELKRNKEFAEAINGAMRFANQ